MKRLLLLLLLAVPAFPAITESIVIPPPGSAANGSVPAMATGDCRFEMLLQNWDTVVGNDAFMGDPCAVAAQYVSSLGGWIQMYWTVGLAGGSPTCLGVGSGQFLLSGFSTKNAYIRYQRSFSGNTGAGFAALTDLVEMWDGAGNRVYHYRCTYPSSSGSTAAGASVGGGSTTNSTFAFFRVYNTLVPENSIMPVTAPSGSYASGCVFHWKFDNSLADDCGSYPATLTSVPCSGSPGACYTSTGTVQNLVVSRPQFSPTSWTDWTSLRANVANIGSAAQSFSQAAGSSVPSAYSWTQNTSTSGCSGGETFTIGGSTTATPSVTPTVLGPACFDLQVTDTNSNTATATLVAGAAPFDSNGIIQQANANATLLFNKQIAFGQNPWGYEDERNLAAINLQIINNPYYSNALWLTTGQGTIKYPFGGVGYDIGTTGTTICGSTSCNGTGIGPTDTSISVVDASKLSLGTLPTEIILLASPGSRSAEVARICTASSLTGNSTLGVCYGGRGITTSSPDNSSSIAAASWANGATAGEMKIAGTSTLFATDSQRPLAPAGVPGPMGPIITSTGTVALSGTTATFTGATLTGVSAGMTLRVAGTHGGGTAFVWWDTIVTVNTGAGTVTYTRPFPATADSSSGLSFKITQPLYLSLEMSDSDGTYRALQNGVACESETACYGLPAHDISAFDTACCASQSGLKYSYELTLGAISATGPNFYGTGLAAREFYYRSGYGPALILANQIDENWPRDPEVCGGYCGGFVLNVGGGAIGGFADKFLNGSTILGTSDLIGFAKSAATYSASGCNDADQRDSSYPLAWVALYDILTHNSTWDGYLSAYATRENGCKRNSSDGYTGDQINSWATSFSFVNTGPAMTVTTGSTAVTATVASTFTSSMCAGADDGTGTITVTGGLTTATVASGSVASGGVRIYIVDTSTSPATTLMFQYSGSGGATSVITLAGQYPFSGTHTYNFMVENNSNSGDVTAIGITNTPDSYATNVILSRTWACKYVDANNITLNRGWIGTGGTNFHLYHAFGVGFFGQPFMLGIKATAMNWASAAYNLYGFSNGSLFATMLPLAGNWAWSYGQDSNTLGSYYAKVREGCEPFITANPSPTFQTITGSSHCGDSGLAGTVGGELTERVDAVEAGGALLQYYLSSPDSIHRANIDAAYGAIFGYCPYTQGSGATFYCDSHYVNTSNELSNNSLSIYKWTGFFFGMGGLFSGSYPADRQSSIGGSSVKNSSGVPTSHMASN